MQRMSAGDPDRIIQPPETSSTSRVEKTDDIFDLHREVVCDYRAYIESFINIADDGIRAVVQQAFADGQLWPEPLLQSNPDMIAA